MINLSVPQTVVSLLSTIIFSSAINALELPENISIQESIPSWVEIIKPDYKKSILPEKTSYGAYYLLNDRQVYPEKRFDYVHNALRLTSPSGVEENSSISVTIDPDCHQLVWHQIDIVRDGNRIDQLAGQEFRISSNQTEDIRIYDNRINCLAIVEGTKKDDIIEYAYSVIGRNPVLGERYSDFFSLNYAVPVARISGRILRETNSRTLNFKMLPDATAELDFLQTTIDDEKKIHRFDLYDVAPVYTDEDIPNDYITYSYLQVSDWDSWREVSEWGAALYSYAKADVKLPDELLNKLSEWRKLSSDKAKVLAALRWVQEEIRYVAIVIGPHNFKPYNHNQIFKRGFGDCKDKTQLLCYLLAELGIKATPVLVNTYSKGLISAYLPAPSSFDHVITRVTLDDKSYWLDPTYSSQGGSLDTIWHEDYAAGLELSTGSENLISVPGQGAEHSKMFVREMFEINDYRDVIKFTVYSRYSGAEADDQRRFFGSLAHEEIGKNFLNYYAQQYPGIKVSKALEYSDDRLNNIVELNEYYTIPAQWETDEACGSGFQLDTYPNLINSSLFLSDTRIRTMPAAQSFPLNLQQVIQVKLPGPGSFEDEKIEVSTPWFNYSGTVETEGNCLILNHAYNSLVSKIPAENYSSYAEKIEEVIDSLGYSISYSDGDEQISASDIFSVDPYPATFLSATLFGIFGLTTSGWIIKRKRKTPKPAVYPDLDGISGWLFLPAIGIFILPFVLLFEILVEQKDYFHAPWVRAYTAEGSEMYVPGFEILLLFEMGFNTFCLILSLALIYVFVKKRAILPLFYISFSVFFTAFLIIDIVFANYLLTEAGLDPLEDSEWNVVFRSVIGTIIWCTYFTVSDRVRSTFRY